MAAVTIPYKLQLRREARSERVFRVFATAAALLVLALLAGVLLALLYGAWPALKTFQFGFLTRTVWNPVTEQFGAFAALYGTVVTSLIAMILAVPVAFGIAVFLTETCPMWLRTPISTCIELLAAVPSIVFGIWGLFVLAVMVLPFITSVMREVFLATPRSLKEAAYGLGATQWEVVWDVVLPNARAGVVGGIMLGLGRALGETMAVTFVVGNAHRISGSLLAPGTTISASIANEFTEAVGKLYTSSLIALGLLLFVLTFIIIAGARLLLLRLEARGAQL